MSNYPIEGLMNSAMNSIKEMIDVDTIIGEPIETSNNIIIIPVSKVNFGFAAGGSEFKPKDYEQKTKAKNKGEEEDKNLNEEDKLPFGGGAGAGVSISPIAFIIVQPSGVKLLPVTHCSALDKLLDLVPDLIEKTTQMIEKKIKDSEKIVKDNLILKVNNMDQEEKKNEPSEVIKEEAKPYDIEYDETDI